MIAFVYPGQRAQGQAMGEAWVDHPSWDLVTEASDLVGRDIADLLLRADKEELRLTHNAQLATFVLSMVMVDAVNRIGIAPGAHAGHSLGEYTALTSSGALDFADGLRLVAERGEAMQVAAEEHSGTMAAILGLDDHSVEHATRDIDNLWVANYNSPGQVVIAGGFEAVEAGGAAAKELGAKRSMQLSVGGAFHTPHMAPAQDRLDKALAQVELRSPDTPVYSNVDAEPHRDAPALKPLLGRQLTSPVRWSQSVRRMIDDGCTIFVEMGPGTALTGMIKRIDRSTTRLSVDTPDNLDALLEALNEHTKVERSIEGEMLYMTERLVVSPAAGVFLPVDTIKVGDHVESGELLGHIADAEVRSPFTGEIMGFMAVDGERVTPAQPVAWLRAE